LFLPLALLVAGCAGATTPGPTPEPALPSAEPTLTETALVEPTATVPAGPSFQAAVYLDDVAGFAFDYPAGWFVGPVQQYSRGGVTAFTSWERPTDVLPGETPAGETRLDATVQLWDPKGDLQAFVDQRMLAWEASGITVLAEESWSLDDGRAARAFVVAGIDGAQAYFFFTTIGENYLVLSGSGDLALLSEIGHTVRPPSS
jgi:hypothetical protein